MGLCTASRRYISALPQWDGSLPHGRRFVGLAVKVLEAYDAFYSSAVQHKPTPVPFLQNAKIVYKILPRLQSTQLVSKNLTFTNPLTGSL